MVIKKLRCGPAKHIHNPEGPETVEILEEKEGGKLLDIGMNGFQDLNPKAQATKQKIIKCKSTNDKCW